VSEYDLSDAVTGTVAGALVIDNGDNDKIVVKCL